MKVLLPMIIFITICSYSDAVKYLRKLIVYYPTGSENIKKDFTPYNNNY